MALRTLLFCRYDPTMGAVIFYDVAQGKPLTVSGDPRSGITRTVDLLWQYKFTWIIIDRWTEDALELSDEDDTDSNPLSVTELSTDGENFTPAAISRVVLCSEKGSRGTHRSLQLFFPKKHQDVTYGLHIIRKAGDTLLGQA